MCYVLRGAFTQLIESTFITMGGIRIEVSHPFITGPQVVYRIEVLAETWPSQLPKSGHPK